MNVNKIFLIAVIENIAWCGAFLTIALVLDGWWKILCLPPLMLVNTSIKTKKGKDGTNKNS